MNILRSIIQWIGSLNWSAVRPLIIEFLKSQFAKVILMKLFGKVISGGYKNFIAKLIVDYAFEELALPIIQLGFRKMGYVYHRAEGEIIFRKMEQAKENNDKTNYDKAVDSIFNN